MTIQRAINVEVERFLQCCEQAAACHKEVVRQKRLHLAHIHYLALKRLRKFV